MIHNDKGKTKALKKLQFCRRMLEDLEEDISKSKYTWKLLLLTNNRIHELQEEISEHDNYSARQLVSQLIRSFVNVSPSSKITEEAIRMSYLTDRQIKMLLKAKDFVYAT